MNINYPEIVKGMLSVELRGFAFFALALTIVFLLRKRSARMVAACWRSVFAAAMVMIVIGFAKPMLVMELVGSGLSQPNKMSAVTATPRSIPEPTALATAPSNVTSAQIGQVPGSQSNSTANTGATSSFVAKINWPATALTIWFIGMIALLIRPLTGAIGLAKLHRQSQLGDEPLIEKFNTACKRAGISGLKLRALPTNGAPFVAGALRPTLYVPTDASEWDNAEWEIILRHEVAHVHHFDGLFNLLAQLCLAAYWINPLAWIAYRQLKVAQECAADDSVLYSGVSANEYAGALLKFCAKSVNVPTMAMPMARPSTMRLRIERILDSRNRRTPDRAASRLGAIAMITLAAIIGTTVFVRAEKAANQALTTWTFEQLVKAITEPQAVPKAEKLSTMKQGWPEKYNQWGGTLSLTFIEKMLQNDLYLSSPHQDGIFNLRSKTSFGHHNPAALDEMTGVLKEVLPKQTFVDAFQPAYDEHLKQVLRTHLYSYKKIHELIQDDPAPLNTLRANYNAWIAAGKVDRFTASFDRTFRNAVTKPGNIGKLDWYETRFATKFWARRLLDGTDQKFAKMLATIMVTMDPMGPLSNVPEELDVEATVTAVENGIRIQLKKSNVPADQLTPWTRINDGPWVNSATRDQLLEGPIKIEWQYRLIELNMITSDPVEAKLEIKGTLRESINKAIENLTSDDFKVRSGAQQLLDNLDVQATPFLETLRDQLEDVEVRLRLTRAIKAIAH